MNIFKLYISTLLISTAITYEAGAGSKCESIFKIKPVEVVEFVESEFMQLSKVKTGDLSKRVSSFVKKYPNNIKLVKNVEISMSADSENWNGSRDLLVISLKDLTYTQQQELVTDYTKYLAYGTVSFPLGIQAGHLYTRFGEKTMDYMGSLSLRPYRLASGTRLEPFVALSQLEQANLTNFLKNGVSNPQSVLGSFNYDGTTKSNQKLDDNRCSGGHNCTSWISTSGIGAKNSTLMSLVGMNAATEQGTNPGWWSAYLNIKASAERVPFSVYMDTNNNLEQIVTSISTNNNKLYWDFSPH